MPTTLLSTQIDGLPKFISGKVRDVYDLGDRLLVIATDRLSAFDVILPTGIEDKGRVLTQLSLYWYEQARPLVANHLVTAQIGPIVDAARKAGGKIDEKLAEQLAGRTMLVKKAKAFPIECVARGYLSGSLWKEYKSFPAHGGEVRIYDIPIPVGLRESDAFPAPIFTPATKAETGHDENISFAQAAGIIGDAHAARLRDLTLAIYSAAANQAKARGIIIADTKFEFGLLDGEIILIDEALTPDSSRFWDAGAYKPGGAQPSFDKQYVRDYLETLDWGKTYPGPALPYEVAEVTADKYRDAYLRVTGKPLSW
ncbi:MAG: phosphoribosylaminoimidazolesuccinocarboxamide synthase [Capsulimonadaceae bacterium]|nr:phosphoribosylaminoimidazolesuccinocarboxamide synthase [Capsulimonadaceae bacterium]